MNLDFISEFIIPIIVAGCLCVGYVMKQWLPTDNKYIPTVLLILGAISGIIVNGLTYEGVVIGMVSGLAAVGLHQAFKQYLKVDTFGELTEEEANIIIDELGDFEEVDDEEEAEAKEEDYE